LQYSCHYQIIPSINIPFFYISLKTAVSGLDGLLNLGCQMKLITKYVSV